MLKDSPKVRFELIDSIRGITLISMIIYHFVWDMVYLYGHRWTWFYGAQIWQQSICWTFIVLSGFSFSLGRRHLKRGLFIFGGGALVTLITLIFTPQTRIIFGILTLIGSCMLIMIPIYKFLIKIPAFLGAAISFLAFVLTKSCNNGYIGFLGVKFAELPDFLYKNYLTAYLGFPPRSFYSSDYFSVFPWFFLFLFGFFIFHILEKHHLNEKLFSRGKFPLVNFLGKHSLLVYLLHQPIIYGVCEAIKYII